MRFKVAEAEKNQNYILLTISKDCLSALKEAEGDFKVEVDFNALNIRTKLYGDAKIETKHIQKQNCKQMLKLFKICKKAIKILKDKNFDGTFYVRNLKDKKNNNDYMLCAMLETSFAPLTKRLKLSYEQACMFLDRENSLNKMCDFHDNRCAKHRAKGIEKNTGCCASFCKLREACKACTHKNLACKIFMCDYLIKEKGFYFTPNTIPVLKQHMTIFERACCFGLLCRTEKKALSFLKMIRGVTISYLIILIGVVVLLCL